ncbi:MAG TPA: hypothetical protein VMH02_01040 [Verrucomicrobiae bacterium]|nr:hypothetical protein [Verrucomicrobiae bacterium]
MRSKNHRLIAALAVALALCGCGNLTKSPAEGLTFKAPPDWHSSPGIMGMMQFWLSPDGKQMLMLFKAPADWKSDEAFSSADMKDAHVEVQRAITLCGNRPATYTKAIATSSRTNNDANAEMILSKTADGTYMALYSYPIGTRPAPAAESAIYELCPAKT